MFTLLLQCAVNDGNRWCVRGVAVYPLMKYHAPTDGVLLAEPTYCISTASASHQPAINNNIIINRYLNNTVNVAGSITPLHCSIL